MLIGELAKRTQTTKDTIRHYDNMGLLVSYERQAGSRGYREYGEENIERIELIRLAKFMGFTLSQVAQQMKAYYAGGITVEQQIALLRARQKEIRERIASMQQVDDYLTRKIQWLQDNGVEIGPEHCFALHEQGTKLVTE